MPLTKVSIKFQVVIPKEVRELLGISKGDTLQVYEKDHEIIMKKAELKKPLSLRALKGLGKEIWKGVDIIEEEPVYFKKGRRILFYLPVSSGSRCTIFSSACS